VVLSEKGGARVVLSVVEKIIKRMCSSAKLIRRDEEKKKANLV